MLARPLNVFSCINDCSDCEKGQYSGYTEDLACFLSSLG